MIGTIPYKWQWSLLKTMPLILLFCTFDFFAAFSLAILILTLYREVIALLLGLKVMPGMDVASFMGDDKHISNVMSVALVEHIHLSDIEDRFRVMMKHLPKLRYTITQVMGDLYYKEISDEEAIKLTLKKLEGND